MLTERCLSLANVRRDQGITVLDIGSGGGSSVFAASKLLPYAHFIASDISPQLLEKLAAFSSTQESLRDRLTVLCFDLHTPMFKEAQIDLVLGMAILHHLVNPLAALKNVASSLKPGGKMIFVEPLEAGHLVLLALYDRVLQILQTLSQDEGKLAELMRVLRLDIQARLGVPKSQSWTPHLDDKWVFGEAYLEKLGRELGMSSIVVHQNQPNLETLYETCFRSLLSDSGNSDLDIPDEVLAAIQEFDRGICLSLKLRMCPTGIIVMTK